jgi:hypothetical protein
MHEQQSFEYSADGCVPYAATAKRFASRRIATVSAHPFAGVAALV